MQSTVKTESATAMNSPIISIHATDTAFQVCPPTSRRCTVIYRGDGDDTSGMNYLNVFAVP